MNSFLLPLILLLTINAGCKYIFALPSSKRKKSKHQYGRSSLIIPKGEIPTIVPKLLVFDLDNTLWTPELYQIRKKGQIRAWQDIRLFDGAQKICEDLAMNADSLWEPTSFAIASRTDRVELAHQLLGEFKAGGKRLSEIFSKERTKIFPGSKIAHFTELSRETGIDLKDMIFFDDDARLNCREIQQMGVLCLHCPRGLSVDLFRFAINQYDEMKLSRSKWSGKTLTFRDMQKADFRGSR